LLHQESCECAMCCSVIMFIILTSETVSKKKLLARMPIKVVISFKWIVSGTFGISRKLSKLDMR